MRRLLLAVAVAILYCFATQWLARYASNNFDAASFDFGFLACILLYVILETILQVKDKTKGGAIANIKITVKDAKDPEQVGMAINTGLQAFNIMREVGDDLIKNAQKEQAEQGSEESKEPEDSEESPEFIPEA